jgi:hypothetical protein
VLVTGCEHLKTEEQIRTELNLFRPALVMTYELSNDTRVNNALAIREGIDARLISDRQVVVVSRIGESGPAIAMERAKKTALLLEEMGEIDPRMYIRKTRKIDKTQWDNGAVELFIFPKQRWNDRAFIEVMNTQSMEVAALGGVLRSDVARISLSEVFMRDVVTEKGWIGEQLTSGLKQLGWEAKIRNMPELQGKKKTYVVSLPESGLADEREAVGFARLIASQVDLNNMEILVDARDRTLTLGYQLTQTKGGTE